MKKKLNQEAGFTLVEMLAATMVLILLTMMLGTGLQMTVRGYQKVTAQSEVDLMLSTIMDALVDDLRFAQDYSAEGFSDTDSVPFTYTSDSFEGKIHLEVSDEEGQVGQIMAIDISQPKPNPMRFLSTGVYGAVTSDGERAYRVTEMSIKPHPDGSETGANTFEIYLKVQAVADESIKAEGKVTVRCLNRIIGSSN